MVNIVAVLIAALAIGVAGYFLFYKKSTEKVAVKPDYAPFSHWDIVNSPNMNGAMSSRGDGTFEFNFPNQNGVHYVQTAAPALALARTVSMTFAIEGEAEFTVSDPNDKPPLQVRLYMQRVGDNLSGTGEYEFYRWWSNPAFAEIKSGQEATVTAALVGAEWSSVRAKTGIQETVGFTNCVANAAVIGFTFGHDFSGHGGYASTGTAKFILKSYTVQ